MGEHGIELTEFIAALRRDLHLSVAGSVGEALRFAVDDIELTLEIKAARTDETSGSGKLRFWVVEAGGSGKTGGSQSQTQKVTLKLKPVWKGDERYRLLVADDEREKPR